MIQDYLCDISSPILVIRTLCDEVIIKWSNHDEDSSQCDVLIMHSKRFWNIPISPISLPIPMEVVRIGYSKQVFSSCFVGILLLKINIKLPGVTVYCYVKTSDYNLSFKPFFLVVKQSLNNSYVQLTKRNSSRFTGCEFTAWVSTISELSSRERLPNAE